MKIFQLNIKKIPNNVGKDGKTIWIPHLRTAQLIKRMKLKFGGFTKFMDLNGQLFQSLLRNTLLILLRIM